uniref:K Homology domain-containing protein n=1 Tax=Manihot esculenta TaxID=3983 RepID=A0A2C9U1M2_MANES
MFILRLLVLSSQVGCLLGKGGSIIKQMGPSSRSFGHPLPRPEAYPPQCHSFNAHGTTYGARPRDFHKSGGVIGKAGTIIRNLRQESSFDIKVLEGIYDSEDYIILISGPANDRISTVQDAVLRRMTVIARLLVSSNQIGCLLGKGGSMMAETRKSTGGGLYSYIPKCASENAEVVQENGDDPPPHGGFHLHDGHSSLMDNIHRLGLPHISKRKPWCPQGVIEGGPPLGLPDIGPPPPKRKKKRKKRKKERKKTFITTVQVVAPCYVVPVIHGEDGCLEQFHQIYSWFETVTIISGTLEHTHAAQSLIQAFVMSEASPLHLYNKPIR